MYISSNMLEENIMLWYFSGSGTFETKYIQSSSMIFTVWDTASTEMEMQTGLSVSLNETSLTLLHCNFLPIALLDASSYICKTTVKSWSLSFVWGASPENPSSAAPGCISSPSNMRQAHEIWAGSCCSFWRAATGARDSSAAGMGNTARVAPSHIYFTVSFNFIQNLASLRNKWFPYLTQYHWEEILRSGWSV